MSDFTLLTKQKEAISYLKDNTTKEVLYGGAAGGGKSLFGCLWLIECTQKYPKSRWLMGRSKLKSLKETTLNTFFDALAMFGIVNQYTYNAQAGIITHINGSEIILKDLFLYPSDPNFDGLGSLEITGAFIDEANQVVEKAKNVVLSRIRYKLNTFGLIPKLLMTCNPAKNWTYSSFYKAFKEGVLKITRKFIQALPTDNPHLPQSYLDSLLELDKASVQRLYYGNWEYDNDENTLMPYDKITDLFTNSFVEGGAKYITCDVARMGSDKTVIMVWDGFIVTNIIQIDKNTITELSEIINQLSVKHKVPKSNIVADEDGVGGGLVDMAKVSGFVNNSKALNGENYSNLKNQCYYKLVKMINGGKLYIQPTIYADTITQELEQIKAHELDKDGKLKVTPKKIIKNLIGRSPDFSDALMMRMYFEVKTTISISINGGLL